MAAAPAPAGNLPVAPPPIAVPPLHPFLEHPGEPPEAWTHWMAKFENHWAMVTLGRAGAYTPQEKSRYLLLLLGTEGQRLVRHLPAISTIDTIRHDDFIAALRAVLVPRSSPFRALAALMGRRQRGGETVNQYMADLRDLASRCPLPQGQEDFWVASILAIGCASDKARERLYTLPEVDLTRVMEVLLSDEAVRMDLGTVPRSGIGAVSRGGFRRGARANQGGARGRGAPRGARTSAPSSSSSCSNCGGPHRPGDDNCPAKDKLCHQCKRKGHLKAYCRSGQASKATAGALFVSSSNEGGTMGKIQVLGGASTRIKSTVRVWTGKEWAPMEMEVDTGASVSTLRRSDVNALQIFLPLEPAGRPLLNYDQSALQGVRGTISTRVQFGGREAKGELHVVSDRCSSILGRDFLQGLRIVVDCGEGQVQLVGQSGTLKHPGEVYPKLFGGTVGTFPNYQHRIQLKEDAVPSISRLRSIPLARKEQVLEEIRKMDNEKIWEPVQRSEWVHGLVTVPKEGGGVRITTDLSPLNPHILPELHPIPSIKELLGDLQGAQVFSKMDFRKGFFHIPLHPDSRHLTTTVTPLGLRQYKRLPMGLRESSSVFQRLVGQALAGLQGVIYYVDDILVYGRDRAEHDRNLKMVLDRLQEFNFRLAQDKCRFGVKEVAFLGHIIGADGVRPDPKNLKGIEDCVQPSSVKDILVFLGMVDFYRDFVRDVTSLEEPLRKLTRKGQPWQWEKEQDIAFRTLKAIMKEDLKVHLFDPAAPTILTTDASDVGVGAMLSQIQNGKEVPIAFASSTLTQAQRNYSASEKEAWAVVWACEHWEKYLLGRHFTLQTDHSALKTMLVNRGSRRESSKFHRWLERLSPFSFTPHYIKGEDNRVADALSRLVQRAEELGIKEVQEEDSEETEEICGISTERCAEETVRDKLLSKLRQYVTGKWPKQSLLDADLKNLYKIRTELSAEQGCVWKTGRILVPTSLRNEVLKEAHRGHPGIVRLKRLLRQGVYWPGMAADAERWVRGCQGCALSDKSAPRDQQKGRSIPAPADAGAQWGVDISGPFFNGQLLLVAVDYATGWPEVLSKKSLSSRDIIDWLEGEVFSRYGLPRALVTDNGPQFISHEFREFLQTNDIHHIRAAVYNPTENGLVERFNRTLKTTIQAGVVEGDTWNRILWDFLRSYRATPREGGMSPAEGFLGRQMRLSFKPNPEPAPRWTKEEAPQRWAKKKMKAKFSTGDKVGTRAPQMDKGLPAYKGPKVVKEVLGRYTFLLSDGQKWNSRKLRSWPEGYPAFVPHKVLMPGGVERPREATEVVARPQRQKKPPDWYDPSQAGPQHLRDERPAAIRRRAARGGAVVSGNG